MERALFRNKPFDLARPLVTGVVTALGICVSTFGLTDLIDKGYGAICYGALGLFALPMLTVGVHMIRRSRYPRSAVRRKIHGKSKRGVERTQTP